MNVVLLVGIGSFVASLTGFILNIDKALQYIILLLSVGILTYVLYLNIDDTLQKISEKIKELKDS